MIGAVQRAHYVDGRRVVKDAVLVDCAGAIGLDPRRFRDALGRAGVDTHVADTRTLMRRQGRGGFPSFLVEHGGAFIRLSHEGCYGRPEAFVAAVRGAVASRRLSA